MANTGLQKAKKIKASVMRLIGGLELDVQSDILGWLIPLLDQMLKEINEQRKQRGN